ncbi:hypothetical protein NX059_001067 [Plenodomus lindquistii]|nr:hypothetical protein NX059_001067 [Plenodomus lindquistii]
MEVKSNRRRDIWKDVLKRNSHNVRDQGEGSRTGPPPRLSYISAPILSQDNLDTILKCYGDTLWDISSHELPRTRIQRQAISLISRTLAPTGDYIHNPLDQDHDQFRLFHLQHHAADQSESGDTTYLNEWGIRGELSTFEFDHASTPEYVALSYTWGNPEPLRSITINDQRCGVRDNLFKFLRAYARDPRCASHPFLWIDQLCIDQTNTSERNHQVRQMKNIYSHAQLVVSWLDDSSYKAACVLEKEYSNDNQESLRKATTEMLSNVYFTRLWIVQEFLLAVRLLIFCRDIWIDRDKINQILKRNISRSDATTGPGEYLFHRSTYRPSGKVKMNLSTCLMHWASLGCEDSRDKVYDLLGVVSHVVPDVDYDKSVEEVYLDAVECVLIHWDRGQDSCSHLAWLLSLARHMYMWENGSPELIIFLDNLVLFSESKSYPQAYTNMGLEKTQGKKPNRWWVEVEGQTPHYEW